MAVGNIIFNFLSASKWDYRQYVLAVKCTQIFNLKQFNVKIPNTNQIFLSAITIACSDEAKFDCII